MQTGLTKMKIEKKKTENTNKITGFCARGIY